MVEQSRLHRTGKTWLQTCEAASGPTLPHSAKVKVFGSVGVTVYRQVNIRPQTTRLTLHRLGFQGLDVSDGTPIPVRDLKL